MTSLQVFAPKRNAAWYPAFTDRQGHRLRPLSDIAGKPIEPHEMAALLAEIRQCSLRVSSSLRAGPAGVRVGTGDGSFTPLDVAGMVAWFDLQDAASYTVVAGPLISAIGNKVSSVSWTEATNRPGSAASLNGYASMTFNGSDQRILSAEGPVVSAMTKRAMTTLYAAKHDNVDALGAVFGFGDSAAAANSAGYFGIDTSGDGAWSFIRTTDAGVNNNRKTSGVSPSHVSDTTPHVFCWRTTTAVTTFELDGAPQLQVGPGGADVYEVPHSSAYGTVAPDRVALGCWPRSTIAGHFLGKLGEYLFNVGDMSSAGRAAITDYLGAKWSIAVA